MSDLPETLYIINGEPEGRQVVPIAPEGSDKPVLRATRRDIGERVVTLWNTGGFVPVEADTDEDEPGDDEDPRLAEIAALAGKVRGAELYGQRVRQYVGKIEGLITSALTAEDLGEVKNGTLPQALGLLRELSSFKVE